MKRIALLLLIACGAPQQGEPCNDTVVSCVKSPRIDLVCIHGVHEASVCDRNGECTPLKQPVWCEP